MKIYFDDILLNKAEQPPKTFSVNGENLTSREYAINAQSAIIRQNKNSNFSLTLEIQRTHETEANAAVFAVEHCFNLNCTSVGTLKILEDEREKLLLENTVLESVKTSANGHGTISKYDFLGTIQ